MDDEQSPQHDRNDTVHPERPGTDPATNPAGQTVDDAVPARRGLARLWSLPHLDWVERWAFRAGLIFLVFGLGCLIGGRGEVAMAAILTSMATEFAGGAHRDWRLNAASQAVFRGLLAGVFAWLALVYYLSA